MGSHTTDATVSTVTELAPPPGAEYLRIQTTGQAVRYVLDGGVPTATQGFRIAVNEVVTLPVFGPVFLIQEAATATIQYQWGYGSR